MAFIEPMHHDKRNITYLEVSLVMAVKYVWLTE